MKYFLNGRITTPCQLFQHKALMSDQVYQELFQHQQYHPVSKTFLKLKSKHHSREYSRAFKKVSYHSKIFQINIECSRSIILEFPRKINIIKNKYFPIPYCCQALCPSVHFCVCVSKSLRKWTQTDTKVTFHPPTRKLFLVSNERYSKNKTFLLR